MVEQTWSCGAPQHLPSVKVSWPRGLANNEGRPSGDEAALHPAASAYFMGIKNSSGSNFSLATSNGNRRMDLACTGLCCRGPNLMCRRVYRLMKLTTRGLAHLVANCCDDDDDEATPEIPSYDSRCATSLSLSPSLSCDCLLMNKLSLYLGFSVSLSLSLSTLLTALAQTT